ncbi:muconolactone Delta-isomerase family protein [Streptomyces shenzhenensis]|uniref:muconolactone Delta-isomerase family protein n=1 Tax=Streptomyces shenzhenensis TaxID=943815 RepID=UPI00217F1605|nr:muconolactone Delta-isomerase family protein [Streptomyces shenzhenensis]
MSDLVEFLVNIEIDTGGLDAAAVDRLRAAEARRARELAADGSVVALWRVEGRWANAGIWRAPGEEALRGILDSLPLRPYMRIEWARLTEHPSDPRLARCDAPARNPRSRITLDPLPPLRTRERATGVRRGVIELPELPGVTIRRRSDRQPDASAVAASRHHTDTADRISARVDVDVTLAADSADAVSAIARSIEAAARALPKARIEYSGLTGSTGPAPVPVASADAAIVIGLWHSEGVDGVEIRHEHADHDLDIHIGPLTPRVVARAFDGGDDVMQIRRLVTIDATARTARLSGDQIASFLRDMRSRIDGWAASVRRPSAPA